MGEGQEDAPNIRKRGGLQQHKAQSWLGGPIGGEQSSTPVS